MEESRLSRFGKSIIHHKSNRVLLEEINQLNFYNDKPIKNANTIFLDKNGKQIKLNKNYLSTQNNRNNCLQLQEIKQKQYGQFKLKYKNKYKDKFIDSIYDVHQISYLKKKKQRRNQLIMLGNRKNLYPSSDIDFIGGNLYEIQDLVGDISHIVQKSKKNHISISSKQRTNPLKNNLSLNNNYGYNYGSSDQLSKLDYMLQNYKSVPDTQPIYPIIQEVNNELKSSKSSSKFQQLNNSKLKKYKNKPNKLFFRSETKSNNQTKFTIIIIKLFQLPMIGSKWQPQIYLKIHSYPQQEQYRKIFFKACQLNIKSYSIFNYYDAGIIKNINNGSFQSNHFKLMSQEQYAKIWEEKLINGHLLSQQEKQLLMEFDIEWYRTFIQFCYHSSLEDLLQKKYDVGLYINIMKNLKRYEHITVQTILRNQMIYLKQYFERIYQYTNQEITIGAIRIANTQLLPIQQIYQNFNKYINGSTQNTNLPSQSDKENIQFCIWPLKQDNSSLLILLQLCGKKTKQNVELNKGSKTLKIHLKNLNQCIDIMQHSERIKQNKTIEHNDKQNNKQQEIQNKIINNKIIIKQVQENNWQIYMKIQLDKNNKSEIKISMGQELLFGTLHHIQFNK